MFVDERSPVADMNTARNTGRLPWLASMPSAASELVCVGKIKSNGVSQSLFIDRSEWPPKTNQHIVAPLQSRPHQTRAAAVVAAAAVAAAAPKVICISPVANHKRSHTVIRRAVTPAYPHHLQPQQSKDLMCDKQQTGGNEVAVTEINSGVVAGPFSRLTSKRTFEQTQDYDSQQFRVQLRPVANTSAKVARIVDTDTTDTSSTASTVLPGSSVLLPGWASKSVVDGRHQLRPLLPRTVDVPPACAVTNVITIIPTTTPALLGPLYKKPDMSSVVIPSNLSPSLTAVSRVASSLPACGRITVDDCVSCSAAVTCSVGSVPCLDRSSEATQSVQVDCRSTKDRNEPATVNGHQLLQRIRLIECEMTSADNETAKPSPFYINVVPVQASADDIAPPSQRAGTAAASPSRSADTGSDDEQPPPQMLEALRLVRNPSSRRDVTVTSSPPTSTPAGDGTTSHHAQAASSASAAAAASSAATRLVTMKLVNRCAQ